MNAMNSTLDLRSEPRNEPRGELRAWKAVYTIVERAGAEKKFWVRIGSAFVNRDQSLSVRLDAMPVNGSIHIRDIDEEELERARQRREQKTSGATTLARLGGVA